MRSRLRAPFALALLVGILSAGPVHAAPILGGQIFATGGPVTATFLGSDAAFSSDLYLFSASDLTTPLVVTPTVGLLGPGMIFRNNNNASPAPPVASAPGTTIPLGIFPAGTELVFGLAVNDGPLGLPIYTVFMGPGSRNPDGIPHAIVEANPPPIAPPPFPPIPIPAGMILVGFEDFFGGGDRDFNDLGFGFTGVTAQAVPEPATLLLVGGGMLGALRARARRKQQHTR